MTAQPDSPELLLVAGVDEGLIDIDIEIVAPEPRARAPVGGEGGGDNAAVELGGELVVVVLGVLVCLSANSLVQ